MNGHIYIYTTKIKWKLPIDILKHRMLKVILVCFEYNFAKINRNSKVPLLAVFIYISIDRYCWFDSCIHMAHVVCYMFVCFFYFMNFIINYNQWHNHVNITLFILPNVLCVKLLDPIFKIKFYLSCTCKTVYLSGLNVWQSSNFPDNLSDILCLNEVQKLTMFFLNLQNTETLDFAPYKHLPRWWGRYDCITDSAFVE